MNAKDRYIELVSQGITPTEQDLLDWLDEEMMLAEWWEEHQRDIKELEQTQKGGAV